MEKLRVVLLGLIVMLLGAQLAIQITTAAALREVGTKLTEQSGPTADLLKQFGLDSSQTATR